MDKHVVSTGVKNFPTKARWTETGDFPFGARWGWGSKQSPATIPPESGDGTNFTSCWVDLWTGAENLVPTEFLSSDCPDRR